MDQVTDLSVASVLPASDGAPRGTEGLRVDAALGRLAAAPAVTDSVSDVAYDCSLLGRQPPGESPGLMAEIASMPWS